MEVVELEAVQEEDGGPKPRERGREARETQISERANSRELPRGKVCHTLPCHAYSGMDWAVPGKKNLPSVLLTTNPNPGVEKILLFLARERCTAAPSDSQWVTGGIENTLKVQ